VNNYINHKEGSYLSILVIRLISWDVGNLCSGLPCAR